MLNISVGFNISLREFDIFLFFAVLSVHFCMPTCFITQHKVDAVLSTFTCRRAEGGCLRVEDRSAASGIPHHSLHTSAVTCFVQEHYSAPQAQVPR